jgi:hypothetical protein
MAFAQLGLPHSVHFHITGFPLSDSGLSKFATVKLALFKTRATDEKALGDGLSQFLPAKAISPTAAKTNGKGINFSYLLANIFLSL